MKKITAITTTLILFTTLAVNAQEYRYPGEALINDRNFMQIPAIILVVYIITGFILSLIKNFFDYRIKMRMIDKGVAESMVSQFLATTKKDNKNNSIKWISISLSIGLGLLVIGIFEPWGIISLAIMCFSITFGFLFYYIFNKRADQNQDLPSQNISQQ